MIKFTALLYRRAEKLYIIAALIIFTLPGMVHSQNPAWNSTLVITPNPSAVLSDWQRDPRILSFTVMYTGKSAVTVTFRGTLSSVRFGAIGDVRGNTMQFPAGPTARIFRNTEVLSIQESNLAGKVVQIVKETGRLPEDEYTLCISVLNGQGTQLTQACATFSISLGSQPQLVYPLDKDTVRIFSPTFQWTPAVAPAAIPIRYVLRISEVLPTQLPERALQANVPQFERILSGPPMFVYPSDALPFQDGKIYAWQVQAIDQNGQPASANQGRSDIRTFQYSAPRIHINRPITVISLNNTHVRGRLLYQFADPGESDTRPLINMNIKLVQFSEIVNAAGRRTTLPSNVPGANVDLAQGTTDGNGKFDLNFRCFDSLGVPAVKNTTVRSLTGGVFTGDLYHVIRLMVQDSHYTSPDQEVQIQSGEDKSIGDLAVLVKSYYLKVTVVNPSTTNLNGIKTYILRKIRSSNVPEDEGEQPPSPRNVLNFHGKHYSVVGEGKTGSDGSITFKRLIKNIGINDEYLLYSENPGVLDDYYTPMPFRYNNPSDYAVFNNQYQYTGTSAQITPSFASFVGGTLYYAFADPGEYTQGHKTRSSSTIRVGNRYPLENITVKLVVKYVLKSGSQEIDVSSTSPSQCSDWQGPDANTVLAVTRTSAGGRFFFGFTYDKSMGLVASNKTVRVGTDMVEFYTSYTGDIYRVARVVVESPYYTSPTEDITLQQYQFLEAGDFLARVRSYALNVSVTDQETGNALKGVVVYLLRGVRPQEVPAEEGTQSSPTEKLELQDGVYNVVGKDTTGIDGAASFRRVVKNSGDCDFYTLHIEMPQHTDLYYFDYDSYYRFEYPGDNATFVDEYNYTSNNQGAVMIPRNPAVEGFVYRSDNLLSPVVGAWVALGLNNGSSMIPEGLISTDSAGAFSFKDLDPSTQSRTLIVCRSGFRDTTWSVPPLPKGRRFIVEQLPLRPYSMVRGQLVDEDGNAISGKITIGNGASVSTGTKKVRGPSHGYSVVTTGEFESAAMAGYHQALVIDPDNKNYFGDTVYVNITQADQNIGNFTVYKKLHRINVVVVEIPASKEIHPSTMIKKPIKGAYVNVSAISTPKKTNATGVAEFQFESAGDDFDIKVTAPDDDDYVGKTVSARVPASKYNTDVVVGLLKASRISGHVYAGKSGVEGAIVFLDQGGSSDQLRATTDGTGQYLLRNVPIGPDMTFKAVKGSSQFIGDSETIEVKPTPNENIDFHLKVYNGMDITKLLGFPIEVESLVELGSNKVKITGAFINFPANSEFSVSGSPYLRFTDVILTPDTNRTDQNIPLSRPQTIPVITDQNRLDLQIHSALSGAVNDENGLQVDDPSGTGSGVIGGKVFIDAAASFHVSNAAFSQTNDRIFLALPDITDKAQRIKIPAINSSGSSPIQASKQFLVGDEYGQPLHYSLYGFDAVADSNNSFLSGGKIKLATTLHTNIQKITPSDLNLTVGEVTIEANTIDEIHSTQQLSISLGKWSLVAESWSLTSNGFIINGEIKTGAIDVPYSNMQVTPVDLKYGNFNLASLQLSGFIPLTISGQLVFGYLTQNNVWELAAAPVGQNTSCAYFSNLPRMKSGDNISIANFYLRSDGDKAFTMDPQASGITLYDVATFKPTMLVVFDNFIRIPGEMNLHIPLTPDNLPIALNFQKSASGDIIHNIDPYHFTIEAKGVTLDLLGDVQHPQTLDEKGFIAQLKIGEVDKYWLEAKLYRTKDSTSVWVSPDGQSLNIDANGLTSLNNVIGSMSVQNNDWTNFVFSGDLTGANSASSRLTFVVSGDWVADSQQIGVKDVSTPFGDVRCVYNFKKKQLEGSLHIDKDIGAAKLIGDAELIIDGHWYFVARAKLSFQSSWVDTIQAGILIGDHEVVDTMKNFFKDYSYYYQTRKKFPPSFPTKLNGFWFEGNLAINVLIPSFGFDLKIIAFVLQLSSCGGDLRVGMQFNDNYDLTSFSIGLDVYVKAQILGGVSIAVGCAGISATGILDMGFDCTYANSGDWTIDGNAFIKIIGSAYVGGGLDCDAACGGDLCWKTDVNVDVTMGLHLHYGPDGKSYNFYFND